MVMTFLSTGDGQSIAWGGGGIVLTWVDPRRSAHSAVPLAPYIFAAPSAPYDFNDNQCLQPAVSVTQCLLVADGVHRLHGCSLLNPSRHVTR